MAELTTCCSAFIARESMRPESVHQRTATAGIGFAEAVANSEDNPGPDYIIPHSKTR